MALGISINLVRNHRNPLESQEIQIAELPVNFSILLSLVVTLYITNHMTYTVRGKILEGEKIGKFGKL